MPLLIPSAEVEDYFVTYVFDEAARRDPVILTSILRDYEDGKCICLTEWKLDYDRAFFSDLSLTPNRTAKKLKSWTDATGKLDILRLKKNLDQCADPRTAEQFTIQAQKIAKQIVPAMERIFAGLDFFERRITWRMLETINEDLHVDAYPQERPEQQARMFINLDIVPRIWNTSHSLPELLDRYGDRLTDVELRTEPPGTLVKLLCQRVYGGLGNAGRDGQPRHVAFFAPGDIWLVDSRKVSHQIFYGRRALSLDMLATKDSMADPSKQYLTTVENYREGRVTS